MAVSETSISGQRLEELQAKLKQRKATIAEIIHEYLALVGEALSPEIRSFVERVRGTTDANTLFTTLGRLKRDEKLAVRGTRGAQTYYLP